MTISHCDTRNLFKILSTWRFLYSVKRYLTLRDVRNTYIVIRDYCMRNWRPKNVKRIYTYCWHVYHIRAIDGTGPPEYRRSRTSCINFEKCYFSELTIFFEVDGTPLSQAVSKERVSRAAKQWNKTVAGKVMLKNSIFWRRRWMRTN